MAIVGRIARILLFLLLVAVVFAAGAVSVLTLTEKGRERLVSAISDLASTDDARVRLSGLSGIWSGRLRLDSLVLEDRQGRWLTARDLAVDWSPLALVGLTFSADRVAAGDIHFERLPQASREPSPDGGGFSLPVDISIKALDFPRIGLGASIAGGHVATVAAKGRAVAQATPLDIDAELTATRTDGVAGEVVAVLGFAPSRDRLEIDLQASEPAGGIIAGLLGLPGSPAVDVIVSGSGPAADWKGTGTFAVDGQLVASLEGSHRTTEQGSAVTAKGDGAFASFLPERYRRLAEGETQFDVAGTITPGGGIFVERARVDGTALSVQASGQIDPEGASDFSLELTAAGGGVPLPFGTDEAPIDLVVGSASVRALGDGRTPQLDITAQLPSVATNTVRMTNLVLALDSEAFDLERRVGPFKGSATAAALTIDNPTVEPLVAGEIRAAIAGTLEPDTLTVSSGSLRSDAIDGGFDGLVSLADGAIRLGLKATIQSAALPEGARPLLGETVALSTTLDRAPDGNVSAENLTLESGGLNLGGRALLSGGQIDARLEGTLADIAPALPGGSGDLRLSAQASGSFVAPAVTATLTSDSLGYQGRELRNLELTAGGSLDGAAPDITVALKASLEDQPLTMNGVLSVAEAQRAVRDLSLAIGQNRIAGALTLNEAFLPEGTLTLQLPDLESLARIAGQSVSGGLTGTATFASDGATGSLKLDARAPSIASQGVTATDVTVDATIANYLLDPSLSGDLGATLAGLMPGQPPITFTGNVQGNAAALDATGSLAMDGSTISGFTATYRQTDAGNIVEASGTGALARFLPEQVRALAEGETGFDVSATIGAGGAVDIGRAVLSNQALRAQARGRYVPAGETDITLTLDQADAAATLSLGTPDGPVSVGLNGATLRVAGPSDRPAIDLAAQLRTIDAPQADASDVRLSLRSDGFEIASRTGAFRAELNAASVNLADQTAAPLLTGPVTARLAGAMAGDKLTIESGGLASQTLSSGVRGTVSLGEGPTQIDMRADLARSALPEAIRPALDERVALSARLQRDAEGNVAVENLAMNSGQLSATGSARLAGEALDAQFEAALADIAGLAPDASGAVRLTAGATGTLTAPEISARLTSDRIGFGAQEIRSLDLTAGGLLAGEDPAVQLAVKAQAGDQPLDGRATVSLAQAGRALRDIALSLGENRIAGSLMLDEASRPLGTLTLDLPDLGALAALAGQEIQGSLTGSATFVVDGGRPQAVLTARSERIARGTIVANDVSIDATVADYLAAPVISGAVGATVADLVPGQPPAAIRVTLDGTPADLSADGTLAMEGETISSFAVNYAHAAGGGRVEARGDAVLSRLLPEGVRIVAPDPTRFDIAAILGGSAVRIERATVSNAALTATASGEVDPAGSMDLTLDVGTGTAATLALGSSESPLDIGLRSAKVRATGPFSRPALDIAAEVASIVATGARVSDLSISLRTEGLDVESRSGPLSGSVTAAAVVLDNQTVAPLVAGSVRAEFVGALSPEALSIAQGTVTSDAVNARVSGNVSLAGDGLSLDLSSDVASAALPAAARPVLGERVSLSARMARTATGDLTVNDLDVASGPLAAQGRASLAGGTIDATIEGTLGTVAPLAEQASGAIAFRAAASGNLAAPDLDVNVTSERMTVADRVIEDLEFTAKGRADLANPEADVTLSGSVGGEALNGRAVVATTDGSRALRDLELSLGDNRIVGSLALDENFVPSGSIDIDVPDIGPLAALALEEVEGSVRGNVVFDRLNGAPRAQIALNSGSIRRGDLSVRQADVQAVITDLFDAPGVSGHVKVDEVRSGTTVVRGTDIELAQDAGWTRFNGGANVSGMPAKASGRVQVADGTTTIELATAEATVQGVRTALSRPTTVRIVDGTASLDRLALNLGGGTATVSGTAGEKMALDVQLAALPASLANAFAAGLGAEGPISGEVHVTGTGANPNVRFDMAWTGAQTSQTRAAGVGPLTIRSSGTFAGNRLTFDATAAGGGGIDFRGGGTVGVAGTPQLDLTFRGTVPLRALEAQTAAQGIGLSGTASVDVSVRGPASSPAITGSVRSADARVVYVPDGIALEGIAIDVAMGQGRATINRMTGTLSSGGTVTIAGTVGIADGGLPADLTIRVAEGRYTDGRIVTTTVNADLALRGPLTGSPVLTGTVDLARTVIQIPERLPSTLEALDVTHRDAPAAVLEQARRLHPPEAEGGSSSGMRLDITVNAPQRIFVQGRGLDAELGGSLRLVGSLSAPQATGEFELRRGRLALLGRRLDFTEGTITFAGSLVPTLNFAAESRASDATVTVLVTGPADNPKFSFTSVPALPEDEVLARLIFGRAMGNLSPLQIAQLADAAATLAGRGGTSSLLNNLRDRLGVDDIDVRTNEDGGTSVAVGKYLNDRTYLTIEAGDRAGSSKAAIDLDVGRGVRLRGEAYDNGQTKGGIFFEREY